MSYIPPTNGRGLYLPKREGDETDDMVNWEALDQMIEGTHPAVQLYSNVNRGAGSPWVFAASSFGVKRVGNGTADTATPAVMIPSDVVIPPGILTVGSMVEIYWEITHTTASGNFDPVVYPVLSSYPNALGCDGLRIQPGGAATERGGSGLLRFVVDTPTSQHILANPANLGDTGNPPQKTAWDVLNNGLNINLVSEFPANAPASESVTLKYYSITIVKA